MTYATLCLTSHSNRRQKAARFNSNVRIVMGLKMSENDEKSLDLFGIKPIAKSINAVKRND